MTETALRKKGHVYFVQEESKPNSPIKIGAAGDIGIRLAELQSGNPRKLKLRVVFSCASLADALIVEDSFHWRYHRLRLLRGGGRGNVENSLCEWFMPDENMLKEVATLEHAGKKKRMEVIVVRTKEEEKAPGIHIYNDVAITAQFMRSNKEHVHRYYIPPHRHRKADPDMENLKKKCI